VRPAVQLGDLAGGDAGSDVAVQARQLTSSGLLSC
jgi:hypothetical protein